MDEQLDEIQGEVKTNIEKMLKECEVENKEKASAVEYYNCIFLSGNGDVNTLLNNGTINGTVAQGTISGNGGMGDEGHKQTLYNFHTESGIKDFIGDYAKKRELCTFLSIAFLECIPEFLWIEIRNKLFECMYICSEEKRTIIDEADFSYKDDELEGTISEEARELLEYVGLTDELSDNVLYYEEELLKSDSFKYKWIIDNGTFDNNISFLQLEEYEYPR